MIESNRKITAKEQKPPRMIRIFPGNDRKSQGSYMISGANWRKMAQTFPEPPGNAPFLHLAGWAFPSSRMSHWVGRHFQPVLCLAGAFSSSLMSHWVGISRVAGMSHWLAGWYTRRGGLWVYELWGFWVEFLSLMRYGGFSN